MPLDTGDAAQQLHQVEGGEERRHALLADEGDDQGRWVSLVSLVVLGNVGIEQILIPLSNVGNKGIEAWCFPLAS